ncbi:16S rRNA processing protein RimM [Spiroplasma sp. TIUS-1]|uniref:ribosome maturation factor RimM n=1 Tax=Spiroplasma sp. TIUS-1 TaxID=216963 RepID=UPI00139896CC|nr:ribosome maturation factor RimM [Spiroplasma sp. TIUS-1]QHX35851.1 16S rRNA processing protein RimM [Spiroplasma sp. TIUS-1]
MIKDNLALVGKIAGTHGIKGELKVYWFTETKDIDIKINDFVFVKNESTFDVFKIRQLTDLYIKKPLIQFDEYENINHVQKLVGKEIYIKKELVTELDDYSCLGFDAIFENKKGKVIDFLDNSIYMTYKVEFKDKTIWIPGVDDYLKEIDFDNQKITFINIEGLA